MRINQGTPLARPDIAAQHGLDQCRLAGSSLPDDVNVVPSVLLADAEGLIAGAMADASKVYEWAWHS